MTWLNRTTKEFIPRASPSTMASAGYADFPAGWIENPDLSVVAGFSPKYWIVTGNVVTLMTPAQRSAVDAAELAAQKSQTADQMDQPQTVMRAFSEVVVEELNLHAARTNALLDAIDAAASLAALKTAVAGINNIPTRTLADLKTAVRAKL